MMPDESLGCPYKKPWYMATAVLDGAVTSSHSRRVKARNLLIYEVARPLCDLISLRPVALFVFLSTATGAWIVAADLVLGSMGWSRCGNRLLATVQGELGLWT